MNSQTAPFFFGVNSISYPVLLEARHTYSVPNVGWNQTALQEFIDSCYLLQMHKRSSPCCLNPYDFAHTIYSPCSPDKFIPTLQDQFKYLLCEAPIFTDLPSHCYPFLSKEIASFCTVPACFGHIYSLGIENLWFVCLFLLP